MISQIIVVDWVNEHYNGASYSGLSNFFEIDESRIRKEIEEFMDKYPRPEWAVKQIFRMNGLLENISKNGCGHPSVDFVKKNDWDDVWLIHGCTGECLNDSC